MNNDDNKLTPEQPTQDDNFAEDKNSAENNTQHSCESNPDNNIQPDQTTNADESIHSSNASHSTNATNNTTNNTTNNEAHGTEYNTQNNTQNNTTDKHQHSETVKTWHNKNTMKRGIAMLGYGFIAGFVRLGITIIAVFQFFSLLFSEQPNQPLVKFGQNLNTYQYQINQFLTVNSEVYPFPFADWPNSEPEASANTEYASKA